MSAMTLERGLAELCLDFSPEVQAKLLAFAALLQKWNKVYNLTSIRDAGQVLTHHLLDSLAMLPHLSGIARLADVGSGGGLPGIPLAIATQSREPALAISSIETVNKKATFQQQAKIELGLGNFTVLNERVENVRPAVPFDAVISRAFSELTDFVTLTAHLLRPGGRFLAMKGVYPDDEIARLPSAFRVVEVRQLTVPGLGAERHLIILEHN
ncbi:MAG TPA: 16S rRNA (guanine(527)-N(7))-methyltransferase RsmG [Aromatoleum sp.]|uniref:16S rRNA (guanine(527)-N(7))-methyltransferase RsmG n=1 Tax=Aromatoleum sp. TaxID=2307007 RepID=UPI002B479E7E|nr:16S rRNA (guanine(527)-N(7))-methyltransferase RsmG [Aromatoleum sp.]HJV26774.1 16S rRNA (guanine(527)-N(7))-methyltransferase RsmG [Aromatoleum sp.]